MLRLTLHLKIFYFIASIQIFLSFTTFKHRIRRCCVQQSIATVESKYDPKSLTNELIDNIVLNGSEEKIYSLIQALESIYDPIQTPAFLSFALSGSWDLRFSNSDLSNLNTKR